MEVLKALRESEKVTVITTMDALMDGVRPPEEIDSEIFPLHPGISWIWRNFWADFPQWDMTGKRRLKDRGSLQCAEDCRYFSADRGASGKDEFWDDEIDSIRTFDVETQRSVENRAQITVYPAKDEADPGREVSFLRYFDPEQSLLFLDEPGRLRERGAT